TQARSFSLTLNIAAGRGGIAKALLRSAARKLSRTAGGCKIDQGFSRLWKERIQQHNGRYRLFHLLGDASDYHARVRMADEHNVIEFLPPHFIDDVENVGIEINVGLQQM